MLKATHGSLKKADANTLVSMLGCRRTESEMQDAAQGSLKKV